VVATLLLRERLRDCCVASGDAGEPPAHAIPGEQHAENHDHGRGACIRGNRSGPRPIGRLRLQAERERAAQLEARRNQRPNDEKIGDINEVLIDNSGSVHAVVIGVGGFLGVGEKDVAVPFKSLNIKHTKDSDKIDRVSVRYTAAQIKKAPSFAYYGSSSSRSNNATSDRPARGTSGTGTATPANPNEPSTTPANPAPKR
jgi:PRC-barrel domain protein